MTPSVLVPAVQPHDANGVSSHDTRAANIRSVAILTADAETFVSFRGHLVDALRERGISVSYFGPPVDRITRAWLLARDMPIVEIAIRRNSLSPLADVRSWLAILRGLRSLKPEAVIATRVKSSIYGLLAAATVRVPYRFVFVTGLGYAFAERERDARWRAVNGLARALYRRGLRHATAVAFQNADDERDFRSSRMLPDHVPSTIVNGSGVDTAYYAVAPLPDSAGCVFAGRLLTDKGLGELIDAARVVKAARPEVSFTVIGPEETNPAAFPMAKLLAAVDEGLIEFAGNVADVRPFIAASSIFVLPSYREGTPRSVLEAMAMGRAIITTDVPGCRDTVEHGRNGFLVPPRDSAALADAVLSLAANPGLIASMGAASRRLAAEKYEVRKVTSALISFFLSAARTPDA